MLRSEAEFASFLSYSVRGDDPRARLSRVWRARLKADRLFGSPPELTSQLIAERLARRLPDLAFAAWFGRGTVFVPVPSSSLLKPGSLWVPHRIANEFVKAGLGDAVECRLERARALPKAAWSVAVARPSAQEHYESLRVVAGGLMPARLVLIDDVITRGATLLAAASRLAVACPNAEIRCFAVMRSLSEPEEFTDILSPVLGRIEHAPHGGTFRRP